MVRDQVVSSQTESHRIICRTILICDLDRLGVFSFWTNESTQKIQIEFNNYGLRPLSKNVHYQFIFKYITLGKNEIICSSTIKLELRLDYVIFELNYKLVVDNIP